MSRLRVAAEQAPAPVSAFRRRAHLVDDADGFVGLEVWQSDQDSGEIVMVSRWLDRAAFQRYVRSEEHRVSHDRIPAELQPRPASSRSSTSTRMTSSPSRRVSPPSGAAPPATVEDAAGRELRPLARRVAERHRAELPDEAERDGDAGIAWCLHDNQYLLAWAIMDRCPDARFQEQVLWLARVLRARGYSLERLARDLELAEQVLAGNEPATDG